MQSNKSSGCGPACVAMIADVSEREAIHLIFGRDQAVGLWTTRADLKAALKALGFEVSVRAKRVADWRRIPALAIVGLGQPTTGRSPVAHWVVYDPANDLVYDPIRTGPLPSAQMRRRPISYLSVGDRRRQQG